MSDRISIIPDSDSGKEVKLNFGSFWSFLSSLDYLRFLELEGAFRDIDSRNLYYVEERTELMGFVIRHVVFWINLEYLIIIITGYFFFKDKFLIMHLLFSLSYLILSMWFIHRYTVGRGYLYLIVKDFLTFLTVFVFLSQIVTEFLTFWVVPKLWKAFEMWLLDPSSRYGVINELIYPTALYVYNLISPHVYDLFGMKRFLLWYFALAPVKVFALTFPFVYFLIYSKIKGNPSEDLNRLLKKKA